MKVLNEAVVMYLQKELGDSSHIDSIAYVSIRQHTS